MLQHLFASNKYWCMADSTHPLLAWLKEQEPPLTQAEFARRVPMSESHLSNVIDGKRPISMRLAARIKELTGIPIDAFAPEVAE